MTSKQHKKTPRLICPYCGDPMSAARKNMDNNPFFPFCSRRCKMADLDKWFTAEHSISQPIDELDNQQIAEVLAAETGDV